MKFHYSFGNCNKITCGTPFKTCKFHKKNVFKCCLWYTFLCKKKNWRLCNLNLFVCLNEKIGKAWRDTSYKVFWTLHGTYMTYLLYSWCDDCWELVVHQPIRKQLHTLAPKCPVFRHCRFFGKFNLPHEALNKRKIMYIKQVRCLSSQWSLCIPFCWLQMVQM